MGIIQSALFGVCAWWMLVVVGVPPPVAAAGGLSTAFFTEAMVQANVRSHLKHKATSLQSELNIAIGQLTDMKKSSRLDNERLEGCTR